MNAISVAVELHLVPGGDLRRVLEPHRVMGGLIERNAMPHSASLVLRSLATVRFAIYTSRSAASAFLPSLIMERLLSTYCGDLPEIASISGKSGNIVTDALRCTNPSEMRSGHRGTKLTSSFAPHLPRSPLDKTSDCAICS